MTLIDTIPFWVMVASLYGYYTYLTGGEENNSHVNDVTIPRNLVNTIYLFLLTVLCICIFLLSLFIEINYALIKDNMSYRFVAALSAVFFFFLPLTASNKNQPHNIKKVYVALLLFCITGLIAWSMYPNITLNVIGYKISIIYLVWILSLLLILTGAKIFRRLFWDNITGI